MKKILSALKRMNRSLLRWRRKHPILDSFIACVFYYLILVFYILVVGSQLPDIWSCSCVDFCCHKAWAGAGVTLCFVICGIVDTLVDCSRILRHRKEV